MRVLYFSPRICWPTISGAHLRDFYFGRQLAGNARVTYVGLVNEDARDAAEELRRRLELGNGSDPAFSKRAGLARDAVQVIPLRRDRSYRPANIVRGLLGPTPLNVLNFTSPAVLAELDRILARES